jgi:hypothetical protein
LGGRGRSRTRWGLFGVRIGSWYSVRHAPISTTHHIGTHGGSCNRTALHSKPSVAWLLLLPPLACFVGVFAVIRAITTPSERIFWIGLLVGVVAFGGCLVFIELITAIVSGPETVSSIVARWTWEVIHGTDPSLSGSPRISNPSVVSLLISLYAIAAMQFSLIATLLAQYLMRERDPGSCSYSSFRRGSINWGGST